MILGPLQWRNKEFADNLVSPVTTDKSMQQPIHKDSHRSMHFPKTTISSKIKRLYAENYCLTNWFSPINIVTERVVARDASFFKVL